MSKPHVVFIHLDLGIGGAESLVLNLAKATLSPDHDANNGPGEEIRTDDRRGDGDGDATKSSLPSGTVSIYTTHCSPTHCYDEVRPPHGPLSPYVHIRGAFIPRKFFFGGTALCSAIRMLYLTYKAKKENPNANVFVIDVLPTGVPYLAEYCNVNAGILFYCHFPDKLLTRDTVNGEVDSEAAGSTGGLVQHLKQLKSIYRWVLDTTEEWTMSFSDLIVVNSNFTMGEVEKVFPSLFLPQLRSNTANSDSNTGESNGNGRVQVLYPSIESSLAKERKFQRRDSGLVEQVESSWDKEPDSISGPIVSLNRFERKKNVALVLHAYDLLLQRATAEGGDDATTANIPPLFIAGGYDPLNVENVEHLSELRAIADDILDRYNLPPSTVCSPSKSSAVDDTLDLDKSTNHANPKLRHAFIAFHPSISNSKRTQLLACASVWCYTPHREHFGIVPLEAMDAGVPVVAIKSGGPMETIVDGETGYLVEYCSDDSTTTVPRENATVKGFAEAIHKLFSDPTRSREMGQSGRQRVDEAFGMETFRKKWWDMLIEAQKRGLERYSRGVTSYPSLGWTLARSLGEMIWVVLLAIIVTSAASYLRDILASK